MCVVGVVVVDAAGDDEAVVSPRKSIIPALVCLHGAASLAARVAALRGTLIHTRLFFPPSTLSLFRQSSLYSCLFFLSFLSKHFIFLSLFTFISFILFIFPPQ